MLRVRAVLGYTRNQPGQHTGVGATRPVSRGLGACSLYDAWRSRRARRRWRDESPYNGYRAQRVLSAIAQPSFAQLTLLCTCLRIQQRFRRSVPPALFPLLGHGIVSRQTQCHPARARESNGKHHHPSSAHGGRPHADPRLQSRSVRTAYADVRGSDLPA